MAELKLEIVTPEKKVFDDTVDSVTVPTASGDAGILPNHAPLISALRPGILTYSNKGTTSQMVVSGGFMEVSNNAVSVLTDNTLVPFDSITTISLKRRGNLTCTLLFSILIIRNLGFLAAGTAFLSAAAFLIDCGPGTAFSLVVRDSAFLVTFFNVLGLTFLFVGIFVLIASWHNCLTPLSKDTYRP